MGSEQSTDFLDGVSDGIDKDDLSLLTAKVTLLKDKQLRIKKAEKEIATLKEEERILSREEIPEFLMSKGLKKIETEDGVNVEVQEKIAVSMPKKDLKKQQIAINWLVENGGEAIINNELKVDDPEKVLKDWLMENSIPFSLNRDVNYARLKSFVSGKLGLKKGTLPEIEASEVPAEMNLFIYNETKLK